MTAYIQGYFEERDGFRPTTIKEWEKRFTVAGAQKYLRNHLLKSLKDDFTVAYEAYKREKVGYFALMRIIFPYITFLGSLYRGDPKGKSESALRFMVDYLGRVSEVYKYRAGPYYVGYRHGLTHTNMPKLFYSGRKLLGWGINLRDMPPNSRDDYLRGDLTIYPKLFFEDLCQAIEYYIADFNNPRKRPPLFSRFKSGFKAMTMLHRVRDVPGRLAQRLLRRGLKKYAWPIRKGGISGRCTK